MKKVFISGGNGFIGNYILSELSKRNLEVICYDLKLPITKYKNVKYINGTILDKALMEQNMKGCDIVIHLAAIVGVKRTTENLLQCLNINIIGTRNVFETALNAKVPSVFISSSSEIFGDSGTEKYDENSKLNPKSGYAVSKLACEAYAKAFQKSYGLNYKIVRFFNIYGIGQADEFVIPIFIKNALNKKTLNIFGDGSQIRSFCYATDAASIAVKIALDENTNNQTFNIGNDSEPISMKDLAKLILKKLSLNEKDFMKFVDFSDSDRIFTREIFRRVPNISKIKNKFDYQPIVNLNKGIDVLIENFKKSD